jgi:hypothetical protein
MSTFWRYVRIQLLVLECGIRRSDLPHHLLRRGCGSVTAADVLITLAITNFGARKLVMPVEPAMREFQIDWDRGASVNGLVSARFTREGKAGAMTCPVRLARWWRSCGSSRTTTFRRTRWSKCARIRCCASKSRQSAAGPRRSSRSCALQGDHRGEYTT